MLFSILLPTLGLRIKEIDRLISSLNKQEFSDYEIVIVSQINHQGIEELIKKWKHIKIKHIKLENKGLSLARNAGIGVCDGEWIIFSDDDCWYPTNALKRLKDLIDKTNIDVLLTQIYDPIKKKLYKPYQKKNMKIKTKIQLMSKSSIEIAIRRSCIRCLFDEDFGLGARYVCGEEVDFLLNHLKGNVVSYVPVITVYHLKKEGNDNYKQIIAKGAIYAKHFNRLIGLIIVLRDFVLKHEKNWKLFWQGYNEMYMNRNRKHCFGKWRK